MRAIDNVLVVGAGLAGMTLATALKRSGCRPEVIEIQPGFDVLGVGISIQGPALRVLKSIGLIDQCVQAGFGYSQVVNCDQNGKIEGIVDLPRLNGPQYPSASASCGRLFTRSSSRPCPRQAYRCVSA